MTIYVDHARIPYRGMIMSHLLADTSQELEETRRSLGLPNGCIQYLGTSKEHLDISETKRTLAIRMGARQISSKDLVNIIRARRQAEQQSQES